MPIRASDSATHVSSPTGDLLTHVGRTLLPVRLGDGKECPSNREVRVVTRAAISTDGSWQSEWMMSINSRGITLVAKCFSLL